MVAWHRSGMADIGLRTIGLSLCVISYLAIAHLIALQPPPPEQAVGAESFFLAAVGFLSASAGSAMTCLGNHLFDQVEISARWGTGRRIPLDDTPQPLGNTRRDANRNGPGYAYLGQAN